MTDEQIFNRILVIMEARFDNLPPINTITMDSTFADDLDMDSLDLIEMIMGVETAFNVKLDMTNAKNTKDFHDLINFIKQEKPEICNA